MKPRSVVFLGAKEIGTFCLQYLLENREVLDIQVTAIVGRKLIGLDDNLSVPQLAENYAIPMVSSVKEIPETDFIISVQHNEILKRSDIDKAAILAVNLHMAPLPEYRGCNQFSFAIMDQCKEFGTTLHVLDEGIDNGDILAERRFEMNDEMWVDDLYSRTVKESKKLFELEIGNIFSGKFERIKQEDLIAKRGSTYHYRHEINDLKVINENWPLDRKKRVVRATFKEGFEAPYSIINGTKKYYTKDSF